MAKVWQPLRAAGAFIQKFPENAAENMGFPLSFAEKERYNKK